jgi:hypothetical protein
MLKRAKSAWLGAGLICSLFMSSEAMAGPPYRTDDPEPVDYQHWEFYTFSQGNHISGERYVPSVRLIPGKLREVGFERFVF